MPLQAVPLTNDGARTWIGHDMKVNVIVDSAGRWTLGYRRVEISTWTGRCLVDGVDVTKRCYAADDEEGWADCFVVNDEGGILMSADGQDVLHERLTGTVELVRVPGAGLHVLDADHRAGMPHCK